MRTDWKDFKERERRKREEASKLRGIGMATIRSACGGGIPETASIEFRVDSGRPRDGHMNPGPAIVTEYKQRIVTGSVNRTGTAIETSFTDDATVRRRSEGGRALIPVGGSVPALRHRQGHLQCQQSPRTLL